MAKTADKEYMQRALELAAKGRGSTSPNPMVGAVIVKKGQILAEGYHRKAGTDHAEIVALKKAGADARGATLYVSLEPCCHRGRTGPCTDAIAAAGIKRVVYAMKDPNPLVNGKGGARLRRAGIAVDNGVLKAEAKRLNERYVGFHVNHRPFITLKVAQTLDGRIATLTGDSQWITGPESLKFAHLLRAESDAVLVGAGTVAKDDPSLTVRNVKGKNPYRIIVTSSLRIPRGCRLLIDNKDGKTIIASTADAIRRFTRKPLEGDIIFWEIIRGKDGLIDLQDLVRKAADFGLVSLLVEGGAKLTTSFLHAGMYDKFVAIIAPKLIGDGISAVGDLHVRQLRKAIELGRGSFRQSGLDMIFEGYPERK